MDGSKTESLFDTGEKKQERFSHVIRVAFEAGVDKEFDYGVPENLWPVEIGQRVEAPFGASNKSTQGFCVEKDPQSPEVPAEHRRTRRLKGIRKVIGEQQLVDRKLMSLARWISEYYVCPLGQVLSAMVPSAVKRAVGTRRQVYVHLAADEKQLQKPIRGTKQRRIVEALKSRRAFNHEQALVLDEILDEAQCTKAPAKRLSEKGLIRFSEKVKLRSLPAIPASVAIPEEPVELNDDQRRALEHINREIDSAEFGVTALHGVTGSGKTETYIRAVQATLLKGKQAIILLPEIALTAQTVQRFAGRFDEVAVLHSALTGAQRNSEWHRIKRGEAKVVIGARSAVFAPLPRLGLIVVDEEHEASYKQDKAPRYNGRDVAIKRAQLCEGHCILGSATPSLETLLNCRTRKHFTLLRLPRRVLNLAMPAMKLVDLREVPAGAKGVKLITEALEERLRQTLGCGEQAILLLNRRGYSNLIFCPSCRHILRCRNCDVTLTFHKRKTGRTQPGAMPLQSVIGRHMNYGYARCHHCGAQTLVPRQCSLCGKAMTMIGLGSQRLEEELAEKFPQAKLARVDADSMKGKDYYHVLKDFGRGDIDMLAGTQILAKGLHFPNVTLVGIISADTCLYLPDFRSNERTFQLICQVAGRAGRSRREGVVLVQTFFPEQPAIAFAMKNDYDGFIKEELKHRKMCNLPPYWRLAVVLMRDRNYEKLELACEFVRQRLDYIIETGRLNIEIRGPIPAVISRVQRFHRMQILLQAPEAKHLRELFSRLRRAGPIRPSVKLDIDVDPVNLL